LLETRGSDRSTRHSSTPGMSGSSASTRITSGSVVRARSRACWPERSWRTAYPPPSSRLLSQRVASWPSPASSTSGNPPCGIRSVMRPLPPSASPEGFVGLAQVVQTRGRGVAGLTRRGSPCKSPACAAAPRRLPREGIGAMCGIVGYVGPKEAVSFLVEGLARLEYRGYDSAGVAVLNGGGVETRKLAGRIAGLRELLTRTPVHGRCGIGHTRWATH